MFVVLATVVCIAAAYLCGTEILGAVYGLALNEYKLTLCLCLVGGMLYALACLIYNAIVILRCQKIMIICYLLASVFSLFASRLLVKEFFLNGAVMSYLLSCGILCLLLLILFAVLLCFKNKGVRKSD